MDLFLLLKPICNSIDVHRNRNRYCDHSEADDGDIWQLNFPREANCLEHYGTTFCSYVLPSNWVHYDAGSRWGRDKTVLLRWSYFRFVVTGVLGSHSDAANRIFVQDTLQKLYVFRRPRVPSNRVKWVDSVRAKPIWLLDVQRWQLRWGWRRFKGFCEE